MRISDWSSDVCSSDLDRIALEHGTAILVLSIEEAEALRLPPRHYAEHRVKRAGHRCCGTPTYGPHSTSFHNSLGGKATIPPTRLEWQSGPSHPGGDLRRYELHVSWKSRAGSQDASVGAPPPDLDRLACSVAPLSQAQDPGEQRSEEHTSELQALM